MSKRIEAQMGCCWYAQWLRYLFIMFCFVLLSQCVCSTAHYPVCCCAILCACARERLFYLDCTCKWRSLWCQLCIHSQDLTGTSLVWVTNSYELWLEVLQHEYLQAADSARIFGFCMRCLFTEEPKLVCHRAKNYCKCCASILKGSTKCSLGT